MRSGGYRTINGIARSSIVDAFQRKGFPFMKARLVLLCAGLLTSCGGGGDEAPTSPAPPTPVITTEALTSSSNFRAFEASLAIPERLLQIGALATEALQLVAATPSGPIMANCPAMTSVTGGAGSFDITVNDAGPVGLSPGDRVTVNYRQCPSLTLNGRIDGTVTIQLAAPSLSGVGTATQEFSATVSMANAGIFADRAVSVGPGQLNGTLQISYRDSPEQTRLIVATDATGLEMPASANLGALAPAVMRNARFEREDDHVFARRRVTLQSDTTLILQGNVHVPIKTRQPIPFQGAIGHAPTTGQVTATGDLGGSITVQASGNLTDTSYYRYGTGQNEWWRVIQNYLWFDPGYASAASLAPVTSIGYAVGGLASPPISVRRTLPVTTTPMANPVALTVYLTDAVTQASAQGIVATRLDAAQPDVPVNVEWNHAVLTLRPASPLPAGFYRFRSTQSLLPESGAHVLLSLLQLSVQVTN
jgi:hypothetical protein